MLINNDDMRPWRRQRWEYTSRSTTTMKTRPVRSVGIERERWIEWKRNTKIIIYAVQGLERKKETTMWDLLPRSGGAHCSICIHRDRVLSVDTIYRLNTFYPNVSSPWKCVVIRLSSSWAEKTVLLHSNEFYAGPFPVRIMRVLCSAAPVGRIGLIDENRTVHRHRNTFSDHLMLYSLAMVPEI
jgi:hypothetical protein